MFRAVFLVLLTVSLTGCGFSSAGSPTATVPPTSNQAPATSASVATPAPTDTVTVDTGFVGFLHTVCGNLARGNASGLGASLMYYQYNSGLRWGMLGDGEGHTDDPSTLSTWLAHARPHCVRSSAGTAGHGAVLTSGWSQPGPWSIIEMDVVNGKWKINDFTFGTETQMARAMQVVGPTIPFRG